MPSRITAHIIFLIMYCFKTLNFIYNMRYSHLIT